MTDMDTTNDYAIFSVHDYLREYYADVGPENLALLQFLVDALRNVAGNGVMLDFGGGPTAYSLIAAAPKMREIHYADYSEPNREEVLRWLHRDCRAYDWHAFTRTILELEENDPSPPSVMTREEMARRRVTRVMHCDAHSRCPIDEVGPRYDVLTTHFCAEAAANDQVQWRQCMQNIVSLLKPGGKLILSAVKGADSYAVGDTAFFAVNIVESDLAQVLRENGFAEWDMTIHSVPADRPERHYQGLMFAAATKAAPDEAFGYATGPRDAEN
jgi:nicotinamide N-methyltransferase